MHKKVTASYFISANIVGTDLAPADWGAKIAFPPRKNGSAIRKTPEARLIVGFQLRSAPVSPPGEPGFSGISGTEAGRSGQSFRVFPAGTSQKDLECGIFWICVRAELIESPINLAALTSGQRWHTNARNTHEWLLPFVSFRAKPNPALPAAGKKKKGKRENRLPPFSSNSLFNFKVLYWQGSAWAEPRPRTKTRVLSKQKRKQLWHYIIANTIRTIIISTETVSVCPPAPVFFSFCMHHLWGGQSRNFPFLSSNCDGPRKGLHQTVSTHVEAKRRQRWKSDRSKWVSAEMLVPLIRHDTCEQKHPVFGLRGV